MTHDATANLDYRYDSENRIMGAGGFTYTYDADGTQVKHWQNKAAEKSENHSEKAKGQQR